MRLFGAATVEEMKSKRDVKGLVKALSRDKDANVRVTAAVALQHIGDVRALQPLITALTDSSPAVRHAAADALDELRWTPSPDVYGAAYWVIRQQWNKCVAIGVPAIEPLVGVSRSDDAGVRKEVVAALGMIGGAAALKPLISALQDKDSHVRSAAAHWLGQIGDTSAIGPLIGLLGNPESESAEGALGKIGVSAVEPILAALQTTETFKDWYSERAYKWSAMCALAKIGTPALGPLTSAIKNKNVVVCKAAIGALEDIGDACAVEPLIGALKDSRWQVRGDAARALGRIRDNRALDPLITALADKEECVRMSAADGLGALGNAGAVDSLAAVLPGGGDLGKAAAAALGEIGDVRAVDPLIAALKVVSSDLGERVAHSLGKIGDPRAIQPLIERLEVWGASRGSIGAMVNAIDALGSIRDIRAVEPLIALLGHADEDVRSWTCKALGRIGDARGVEPLTAALMDNAKSVRAEASEALEKIGDVRVLDSIAIQKKREEYITLAAERTLGQLEDCLDRRISESSGRVFDLPPQVTAAKAAGRNILRFSTAAERDELADQKAADAVFIQTAFDTRPRGAGGDFDFIGFWTADLNPTTVDDIRKRFDLNLRAAHLPRMIFSEDEERRLIQAFQWMLVRGPKLPRGPWGVPLPSPARDRIFAGDARDVKSRKRMLLALHDCVGFGERSTLEDYVGFLEGF